MIYKRSLKKCSPIKIYSNTNCSSFAIENCTASAPEDTTVEGQIALIENFCHPDQMGFMVTKSTEKAGFGTILFLETFAKIETNIVWSRSANYLKKYKNFIKLFVLKNISLQFY